MNRIGASLPVVTGATQPPLFMLRCRLEAFFRPPREFATTKEIPETPRVKLTADAYLNQGFGFGGG